MRKKTSNKVTIIDIAKKANVSISTVSRVLNQPQKVKKEKREIVKRIIKQEGFIVSNLARMFSAKHSGNAILFLGQESSNSNYSDFLHFITMILNTYKFNLILHNFTNNEFLNKETSKIINAQNPCVLFAFSHKILDFITKTSNSDFDVVFFKEDDLANLDDMTPKIRKVIKKHSGIKE